jgi:polar amino acid transport system substrate-binding protein
MADLACRAVSPHHCGRSALKFAYLIEPPFNYRGKDGSVSGCDVELARTVFDKLGVREFELVETEFATLLPGVADGSWQMTTGLFATAERRKHAAFSRPIWALPDGLLVRKGNPSKLTGYASAAADDKCTVAVIRDQLQHRSAVEFGVPEARIAIFQTYAQAAAAVQNGMADAYASVARAHAGFIERNPDFDLELVTVPTAEKTPAFGSFAFAKSDVRLRESVDDVLKAYIGSGEHRTMMARFGFSDAEIDLVADQFERQSRVVR